MVSEAPSSISSSAEFISSKDAGVAKAEAHSGSSGTASADDTVAQAIDTDDAAANAAVEAHSGGAGGTTAIGVDPIAPVESWDIEMDT